jgi:Leucine-rich repeat (LRR) protein
MVSKSSFIAFMCVWLSCVAITHAQILDPPELDTARVYTRLDQALANPDAVLRLDLSRQKLQAFPMEIFQLSQLQELRLNKCRLSELPDEFFLLPDLQILQCQHNELDTIPSSIFQLSSLKVLDFADNLIESVPDEITQLSALETLALWDNPITYYAEGLSEMQQLKVLDVLNNAMSRETQERLKTSLPNCKIIMSPPCACMDGDE